MEKVCTSMGDAVVWELAAAVVTVLVRQVRRFQMPHISADLIKIKNAHSA